MLFVLFFAFGAEKSFLAIAEKRVTFFITGPLIHTRIGLAVFLFTLLALVAEKSIFAVAEESVTFVVTNAVVAAGAAAALIAQRARDQLHKNNDARPKNHDQRC